MIKSRPALRRDALLHQPIQKEARQARRQSSNQDDSDATAHALSGRRN